MPTKPPDDWEDRVLAAQQRAADAQLAFAHAAAKAVALERDLAEMNKRFSNAQGSLERFERAQRQRHAAAAAAKRRR